MRVRRGLLGGASVLGSVMSCALVAAPAVADSTVKADYVATLGGFPVGSGTLEFGIDPSGEYRAGLTAQVRGLAAIIANRSVTAAASGKAGAKDVASAAFNLAIDGGAEPNHVSMTFGSGGAVKDHSATTLHFPGWDRRVPLLPEHKKGVIDPLAAFVLASAPGRDPMDAANCDHTAKVFDGRVRYDLRMTYGTKMEVQGKEGYAGPALVCAVAYRPIAGYRPLSPAEEKFERNLEMSIWFVPVAGANVLLPYKVVVGTPFGLLQVYAHTLEAKAPLVAEGQGTAAITTGSVRTAKAAKQRAAQ